MNKAIERIERFSIPEPMSGCWLWFGGFQTNPAGMRYGTLSYGGQKWRAHRLSYEAFREPIPAGLYVCHSCDNSLCVNPEHLFVGTHQDNVDDRERKGRNRPPRGEACGASKITQEIAAHIKWLLARGEPKRVIAAKFNISRRTVQSISAGTNWSYVVPSQEQAS